MTANSKDRQTWRKIPSDAVEEARRRVGLRGKSDRSDHDSGDEPRGTRTSWLPSMRLPGVRRSPIKVIDEQVQAPKPARVHPAPTPPSLPTPSEPLRGGETMRWPARDRDAQMKDPRVPPAVPNPMALAETVVKPVVVAPNAPVFVRDNERARPASAARPEPLTPAHSAEHSLRTRDVPSVKAALAVIDAAASQRSLQLQGMPPRSSHPAAEPASSPLQDPELRSVSGALGAERATPLSPEAQSKSSERSAQLFAMRTPSLTAAPHNVPSQHNDVIANAAIAAAVAPAVKEPEPAPAPAAPEPKPAAAEQPFRAAALRAKSEEPMAEPLPEVTGSGWSVLLVLVTLLGLGLGLAYVGHVEQTSIASGVLQVRGGPRPVLGLSSGPVLSLDVAPGDSVEQGQTIARIDATDLNAREQRDVAQVELAKKEKERIGAAELSRLQADQRALRQKRSLLEERARLKGAAVRDRRERMEQVAHAAHAGVATQGDALAMREAERDASEELLLIRQQITETDLQLTDANKNYQSILERLRHDIENAQHGLNETRTLLQTTAVRAPVSGRVESLLVTQGQVISSGTVLARIVPDGAATSAVVFAPAKDASFLREGLEANLEFASLPSSEFGKTTARVTRVSKDVASAEEIVNALGRNLDEAVIRVELELTQSDQLERVQDKLRSGERLIARLNTRDRRMISMLFDFLRKWYDP